MSDDWDAKVTPGVKLAEGNKHGFVGVYFDRRRGTFQSELWHEGHRHRSPRCQSAAEAAKHYDELVRELRGAGYPVNFPAPGERGFRKGLDLENFCARGHPREENTYCAPGADRRGGHCRKCQLLAAKRMYARKKRPTP